MLDLKLVFFTEGPSSLCSLILLKIAVASYLPTLFACCQKNDNNCWD